MTCVTPLTIRPNIRRSLLVVAIGAVCGLAGAASAPPADEAYRRAVTQRAERIVNAIGLQDSDQRGRVVELVADQYVALSAAHDERDATLAQPGVDEQAARDAAHRGVVELHRRFVAALSAELTADNVNRIKDGMTYGVVPNAYEGYLRLLPDLTEVQKRMILANLLEAREHAMDAGSSEEKHRWFGKYKGRINNRLSAAGYDLKQAERDLAERSKK